MQGKTILADEPIASLDPAQCPDRYGQPARINAEGITVITNLPMTDAPLSPASETLLRHYRGQVLTRRVYSVIAWRWWWSRCWRR